MTITITAFERSPDGGKGLARDTRVRWALEEVGQPYEVRLVSFPAMKEPAHLALHPFGQIPTYEEGDLALFETGAIVFHIAEHHTGLLPEDANARARAITWMFAALNTVEPPILELANARLLEGDKPWSKERLPLVEGRVRARLEQLSARLGDADWLDGAFSAGDLLMVSVLLRLKSSGILDEYPNLAAYVARGEARPAYKRAFAAQLAINTARSWGGQRSELPRRKAGLELQRADCSWHPQLLDAPGWCLTTCCVSVGFSHWLRFRRDHPSFVQR
jgi:glutathione S-transferase